VPPLVAHGALATTDVPFVAMELLSGETVAQALVARGAFTLEEALPIARQMASGLAAAHAAGVIHRDFKSHNVILAEGRAVITDFGIARAAGDDHTTGALTDRAELVGTPAYMAPEQVEGAAVSTAAPAERRAYCASCSRLTRRGARCLARRRAGRSPRTPRLRRRGCCSGPIRRAR